MSEYRIPFTAKPAYRGDGESAFFVPRHLAERHDERVMCMQFVCDRRLFGECYRTLLPDYAESMPRNSGVFIRGLIPVGDIAPGASRPGDIDLLVIPYEGNELVLSRSLAIEVKVLRARYEDQSRSPNQYGFSQANHLLKLGFPHVAVAHLIVSDMSPSRAWRRTLVTEVIDEVSGLCETPREFYADMMPVDLIERAYGRLLANSKGAPVGLLAAYMGGPGVMMPDGSGAPRNSLMKQELLDSVARYYEKRFRSFHVNPSYPIDSW